MAVSCLLSPASWNATEGVPYSATVVPARAAHQPQIRLVHQRRRLQRLSRLLLGEAGGGELAELVIDQRQQLLGGQRIAGLGRLQDLRDFAHGQVSIARAAWITILAG